MALFTWWRGDPLPALRELDGFHAAASEDVPMLARLAGLESREVERRLRTQHRPYVASLGPTPVAYGWVALDGADIGELDLQFVLPTGDRYLWDFQTLPAWRGRGIYPRLLQAILQAEEGAARFWIIHAPENRASQAGIEKAGFRSVGELSFQRGGGAGLVPGEPSGRTHAGAILLGVPLIEEVRIAAAQEAPLAPCWRCVIDARDSGVSTAAVACWTPSPGRLGAVQPCACGCS